MSVRGDRAWLGGAGGVQLFTQGRFYIMRWRNPELPGRVSGLVETDSGDLWTNGFSGITHVSAAELNRWLQDPQYSISAEHLDELDGLPGLSGEVLPEPSLVEAPDGKLWFATTKGLAWLDPVAFERNRNRVPPTVIISTVTSGGHTYVGSDGLRLPPPGDKVEIEYGALSLAIPERVLFRYKLDGVDENWQDAGARRQASYPKLRPGTYQFHVIACNNDGVWNEAGAYLNFRVMPAFYQTLWFQALCVVAAASTLWFAYRLRLRQMTARANRLYTERLAERMRIARDLHDTLLQSLAGLSLQLDGISKQVARAGVPEPAVSMITHVRQQVDAAFREARSKVWNLRTPSLEAQGLEGALRQLMERIGPSLTARYAVTVTGQPRPCSPEVEEELLRIAQEAANNASQHAKASEIRIALDYAASSLGLSISDDGRGFDFEEGYRKDGHWGLKNMRERAAQVHGTCKITTAVGEGTKVEIRVPLSSWFWRNILDKRARS
jgi:signal transduction histidine kinase